jgi:hypothetical protein
VDREGEGGRGGKICTMCSISGSAHRGQVGATCRMGGATARKEVGETKLQLWERVV